MNRLFLATSFSLAACGGGEQPAPEAQASTLPDQTIRVYMGCCGTQAVEDALLSAWHQYVTLNAHVDTPVQVQGPDPLLAAQLAARLRGAGFAPVLLVGQP